MGSVHKRTNVLHKVDAPAALDAARRLLSQGVVNSAAARAVCHLHSLSLADVKQLESLVRDGDFILKSTLDATPDWRTRASSALSAGETWIDLQYDWGAFDISCSDSQIHMDRFGENRRLMRQGVGMYVRRHFRTALEKDGWQVTGEGGVASVAREGRTVGRLRTAQDKFSEDGTLELSQSARPQLAQLSSVFLAAIREDPERLSVKVRGSLRVVIESARALGVIEEPCFAYGTLGTNVGRVADGRVLDLMRTMTSIASDGDFVSYPGLRWQDPELEVEGSIFLEMNTGRWTVIVSLSESLGMSAPQALAAIVARFESASSS